jgi:hypothetical protein
MFLIYQHMNIIIQSTNSGAITIVIVEYNLIKIWIDGPAVSLHGSPTVS